MHHYFGTHKTTCGATIKGHKITIDEKLVTCSECQRELRVYHSFFPMAHSERLEGGAR
jgi:hypothetical protein